MELPHSRSRRNHSVNHKQMGICLVLFVTCGFLATFTFQYFFLTNIYTNLFTKKFFLISYTVVLLLTIASYYRAILTDPGSPPVVDLAKTHPEKVCEHCRNWKPPRTHHCRICKKCILMMDHHCPWIVNCVGYYNYKFFVLTTFYTAVICFYYDATVFYTYVMHPDPESILPGFYYWLQIAICVFLNFFSIPMSLLFFSHLSLFFAFATNVEYVQGAPVPPFCVTACCPLKNNKHPYDLGIIHNLKRMCGRWTFIWLLPIASYNKAGFEFGSKPLPTSHDLACKDLDKSDYLEKLEQKANGQTLIYDDLVIHNNSSNMTVSYCRVPKVH